MRNPGFMSVFPDIYGFVLFNVFFKMQYAERHFLIESIILCLWNKTILSFDFD